MISVSRVCPKCGWKIPVDAPEGGCPGCLLESGLRLLEAEAAAEGKDKSSRRGETIDAFGERVPPRKREHFADMLGQLGDYELLEEVGRGGQGVVFRARQKSLNRTVALKVISLGQWASKAHLKRFRREAEAAASLADPGIVPIYEVGERDGSCYFSMQFIKGGQLDEVVKRAPMSIPQAAEFVAKVARTVHYAHEHGILHRDIKPGNILLDEKGEPHLTDFGLARLLDTESTITRTVEVMGTPSYMAPEQASGKNDELTSATDVYGLGAVFYQLLTGHPPFAGGTTYETIKLLLDTEPRPPRQLNPKIDRELSTICLKSLDKDPARRYSSALALAEDLEHWLKHEPIQAKPSGLLTHGRKWIRRNPSTTVLVTLLLALAVGLSVTLWNRKPKVVIPKSVAVLPFENLSDDPNNAYFADGVQQEILTRLAGISDLKVISRSSTQRYHSKPANLAEIAKQLGVANILEGSVQKTPDRVRVNVQLINAQTDSHLWAESYDRKLTDILGVESEIAKGIAESLKAKLTGHEEQALGVKPTNNAGAYEDYLRGRAFEARNNATPLSGSSKEAISFYERAVQLDPNFADAWARLSVQNLTVYTTRVTNYAAAGEAAKTALEHAQKLAANSPETLLALGYYQFYILHDSAAAKSTFGRLGRMVPSSSEVPYALGGITRRGGRWDESVAYHEQALALDPRNVELLVNAAWTRVMLRQFPAALKLYDRILDIKPNDPEAMAAKSAIYQAQGNLQEAARCLSEIDWQTASPLVITIKCDLLKLERNYGEIIRLLQARLQHLDSPAEKAPLEGWLALAQRLAGDTAGAKITGKSASKAFEQLCKDQPDDASRAYFTMQLSNAYAAMGQKESALNAAEQAKVFADFAKDDSVDWPQVEENLALIQALSGENSRAIATLGKLLQTPYRSFVYSLTPVTPTLLRLDPFWDSLRSDPAFQKLCDEKIDKSIAVLPFENLSANPDNAYFAEGIQEEVLTRLASIADLKVISHTSTSRYKSKPDNLAETAKELGVANILEGSVQKAVGQVRVNVQLVNAQTDSHLWAETYDRKLTDIFGVQSEIAKKIAAALQAKLSSNEERALAVKPTSNPEAYDAYLRGLAFDALSNSSSYPDISVEAPRFYELAVQLDPNFALAWARLCRAYASCYHGQHDIAQRDGAIRALDNAQKLAPDAPETVFALGYYQYLVLGDYAAAKSTFGRLSKMLPSSSEIPKALGLITRAEGHSDQSIAYFEQALALDPRNMELLTQAGLTYVWLRQFPAALKLYDQALDIRPNDPDVMANKAGIYQAQGNLQEAARFLTQINTQSGNGASISIKSNQLRLERNWGEVVRFNQAWLAHVDSESSVRLQAHRHAWFALFQRLAGDTAGAKLTAEPACKTLEQLYKDQPDDMRRAYFSALLSLGYAAMGQKESAIKAAEHAVMLWPRAKDPLGGPEFEENLAWIQTMCGENSHAISTLSQLLHTSYETWIYQLPPITPALLRLDPIWDPLRGDPAFQKLCEEKQP